ncbi:MAG: O-methyltransferase [Bacteroidales bacterium]
MNPLTEHFAESHSTPELPILHKIHRETYIRQPFPRMLSGHLQGLLLQMISKMIRPERILEVGTFTAYSAICLAQGLTENGQLDTVEVNPELEDIIRGYLEEAGLMDKISLHIGDALEIIPLLTKGKTEMYDLVFLDADKEQYLEYYQLVFDQVRRGGYILVDNVLWGGKVIHKPSPSDKEAMGVYRFNEYIKNDSRVERLLLPLRDGVFILRKL